MMGAVETSAQPTPAQTPPDQGDLVRAAIDIGTNSIHLLVARVDTDGGVEVLAQEREAVRLGHGSGDMTTLAADAIERGVACLRRFRLIAEVFDAEVVAVATSAVREAVNRRQFLRRAEQVAGVAVQVITGREEARLIHLGVLQALPVFDRQLVLVDIGGGSTEILVGKGTDILGARSVKLGHIRLSDRFFAGGVVDKPGVVACRLYTKAFLEPAVARLAPLGWEVAVGSSGTINALTRLALAIAGEPVPQSLNGAVLTRAGLDAAVEALLDARTTAARAKLPGLDDRRADVIVGGALLLEAIFDGLGLSEMMHSSAALREGVLLDAVQNERGRSAAHLSNIRRKSVLRMAELYDEELRHVDRASEFSLDLFDQLAARHGYGRYERDLLEAAALLHNVGLFVSHAAHHKHSYYVIRNTDQLAGFNDHEIELMALVARYHRKSAPKPSHPEFVDLDDADRQRVRVLAGILRIAIALDRTRSGRVERVIVEDHGSSIELGLVADPDADLSVELFTAVERGGLLADALGVGVDVAATVTVGA